MSSRDTDYSDLRALFINTTLTRSPGRSHTQSLIDASASIMVENRGGGDQLRSVHPPTAAGVAPRRPPPPRPPRGLPRHARARLGGGCVARALSSSARRGHPRDRRPYLA